MKHLRDEEHPAGGTIRFFELEGGQHIRVLGADYPYHNDIEVWLLGEGDALLTEYRVKNQRALDKLIAEWEATDE